MMVVWSMQRSSISTFLKKETELWLKLLPLRGKYIAFRARMSERQRTGTPDVCSVSGRIVRTGDWAFTRCGLAHRCTRARRVFTVALGALLFGGFCLGSFLFHLLCGRADFAKRT